MAATVFITGGTGNIGGKLIAQMLTADPSLSIVALVRGQSTAEATTRLLAVLQLIEPTIDWPRYLGRVEVLCGDVTAYRFGMGDGEFQELAGRVTHIIHCAASTKFSLPVESARDINLCGTIHVLSFARLAAKIGRLARMAHVSTAFVCGDNGGTIFEERLAAQPRFANTYEQSKWEAECLVRSQMPEVPLMVFRPSVVVGDSRTGRTTAFNVLYTPLRLISRGELSILPCSANTPLDVVPVEYVGRSLYNVFFNESEPLGRTYHLAAGPDRAPTVGEIVDGTVDYFNGLPDRPGLRRVSFLPYGLQRLLPHSGNGKSKRLRELLQLYNPYIGVSRTFDVTNTSHALTNVHVEVPRLTSYLQRLLDYCVETDWGRRHRLAA